MKKLILFLSAILILCAAGNSSAQTPVLIHYWNFDNTPTAHIAPGTPTIPDIAVSYTVITNPTPKVTYYELPGTSLTAFDRYVDPYTGTDSNARYSVVPTGTGGNQALRLRNPLDSMELRVVAPTTGYTNIVMTYALQSSSAKSGDSVDLYDYSVDGGLTWKNGKANGMKVNGNVSDTLSTLWNTYLGDTNWGTVTVDMSADKTVENNPNFVFRFRFLGNTSLTSGNNRFDNLTFEGIGASKGAPPAITVKTPVANSLLVVGRQVTISFDTANGVAASRTIEFSSDGGGSWSPVGTVNNQLTYNWTVPNSPTTTGVIRVTDADAVTSSSGEFTIISVDPKTNTIIHYWDFNSVTGAYHNPNIPVFNSDFSANVNAPGSILYYLVPGTPSSYGGYIDNVTGDAQNAQFGVVAGNALRVRNPVDMVELRFNIPTTGYTNISFKYVIEESSNVSPLTRNFDYSVDGGNTWLTTGLSITTESNLDSTKFDPVAITFATGSAAENSSNLIFRIKMTGSNNGTSGNDRYDNVTVEGTPSTNSVATTNTASPTYTVYPNPTSESIELSTTSEGMKTISISDVSGREVLSTSVVGTASPVNVSTLASGMYFMHIYDQESQSWHSLKFVKKF